MYALLTVVTVCFGDRVDSAYLHDQAAALYQLHEQAETRQDTLLTLYRLFPLTADQTLLESLPTTLDQATPTELALLSALWAYRIKSVGPLNKIRYGQRAMTLLNAALARERENPFVLLIEGQSLLYRPEWAGGNKRAAIGRFERLHKVLTERPQCGISSLEAESWRWLALIKLGEQGAADRLRRKILSEQPPRLIREFVTEPPS